MRIAFWCQEASTLAWQRRLYDEGCDLLVYMAPQRIRRLMRRQPSWRAGDNVVPKAESRDQWITWGMRDPNTIWFFDMTDAGEHAEALRKAGRLVVGAGTFCDKLEANREFGFDVARECGMQLPPYHAFTRVSAAIAFLKGNPRQRSGDGGWAWKSNRTLDAGTFVGTAREVLEYLEGVVLPFEGDAISCILQERIAGVALSTARWWNGRSFTGPFEGTLEHKKFLTDDLGPATGCALNLVWFYREYPKIATDLHFDALELRLRKENAPPALYDINAVVDKRGPWFLEWTPRLGIDAQLTSQRGYTSLARLLESLALGHDIATLFDTDNVYASVRLSVPPYPTEVDFDLPSKKNALGVPIHGADGVWEKFFVATGVMAKDRMLQCADPAGYLGVACHSGTSLETIYTQIYDYLKNGLRVADLQYRTDAATVIAKDLAEMEKVGYGSTPVLDYDEAEVA